MTLTEAMVATVIWGLTATGVLQIWVASGRALALAQNRQQALEAIDADLLRVHARLQRQRLQIPNAAADCRAMAAAMALDLQAQPLAARPGLSRRLWQDGDGLWVGYSYSQGQDKDERQRLLSPEAFGLCTTPSSLSSSSSTLSPSPSPSASPSPSPSFSLSLSSSPSPSPRASTSLSLSTSASISPSPSASASRSVLSGHARPPAEGLAAAAVPIST